jgi:hypothetical protein
MVSSRSGLDGTLDSFSDPLPVGSGGLKLAPSGPREPVVFGAPVRLGFAPLGREPSAFFESMKSGEERARLDVKHSSGDLFDAASYFQAVTRAEAESPEDEQIECTFEKFSRHLI